MNEMIGRVLTESEKIYDYIDNLKKNFDSLVTLKGKITKPMPRHSEEELERASATAMNLKKLATSEFNLKKKSTKGLLNTPDSDVSESRKMVYLAMHAHKMRLESQSDRVNTKFAKVPSAMKNANMLIYGQSLAEYVLTQLLVRQLDSLWQILAYIMYEMPTVSAIKILDANRDKLLKVQNIKNLDLVLTSIIQSSTYPIAAALYLSVIVREAAQRDLSRSDDFNDLSSKYINIALQLANDVESDHLLTLLLETPTDIAQQTVFEIVMKFEIQEFMDNSRIQMIMIQMYSEFDFLNPHHVFRTTDISLWETLLKLVIHPAEFYYCPIGRFYIESIMYMFYVLVVTAILYNPPFIEKIGNQDHHHLTLPLSSVEVLMWICNVGYFIAEVSSLIMYGVAEYITDIGNAFDIIIMINWILIAIVRFGCISSGEVTDDESASCNDNNSWPVILHMFALCIQSVILWSRIALIFTTNRFVGPFISMIPGMVKDIVNWTFVLSIFFVGFAFGANFMIAGDISANCGTEEGDLESFSLVFEYVFLLLMGQSEWSSLNANDCLTSPVRVLLLKIVMWIFSLLGTVLLLNLLIAMMASTYEHMRDEKASQVNFARAQQIYSLAYRFAIIPPPLNVVAYGIGFFWMILETAVLFCSKRKYVINLKKLIPVKVDYHTPANMRNNNADPVDKTVNTKWWGLLLEVHPNKTRRIWKNKDNRYRSAKWCRFCRCYMRESIPGTLSFYFGLFRNYRLDEEDKRFITALSQNNGICPECFRPFKVFHRGYHGNETIKTNRLFRREIVLEMASFWVFMVLVWIPLIILLLLPAVLVWMYRLITAITTYDLDDSHNLMLIRDERTINGINKAIADQEEIEDQIEGFMEKMEDKFKFLNQKLDLSLTQINKHNSLSQKMISLEDERSKKNDRHQQEMRELTEKLNEVKKMKEDMRQQEKIQRMNTELVNQMKQKDEELLQMKLDIERYRMEENQRDLEAKEQEQEVIILRAQIEKLRLLKEAENKKMLNRIAMTKQFDDDMDKIKNKMYNNQNEKEVNQLQIRLNTLKMQKQKSMLQLKEKKEKLEFVDVQQKAQMDELRNNLELLMKKQTENELKAKEAREKYEKSQMEFKIKAYQMELVNKSNNKSDGNNDIIFMGDGDDEVKQQEKDEIVDNDKIPKVNITFTSVNSNDTYVE